MAPSNTAAPVENSAFSLSGHMPIDASALVASKTLSQSIAEKAASVYSHYYDNATTDDSSGKKQKVKRCDICKPLRKFCHHNAPIDVGTKNEVKAAAKAVFKFFIDQYDSDKVDIVGSAKAYLNRREQKDQATELVVDLVLGIVGVIQAYQTVPQPNVSIPERTYTWNSLPKGTTSVLYAGTGYTEEVNVGVFVRLVASLEEDGPDGTEGDQGDEGDESGEEGGDEGEKDI